MNLATRILEAAERLVLLKQRREAILSEIATIEAEYFALVKNLERGVTVQIDGGPTATADSKTWPPEMPFRDRMVSLLSDKPRHLKDLEAQFDEPDRKRVSWTLSNLRRDEIAESVSRGWWKLKAKVAGPDSDAFALKEVEPHDAGHIGGSNNGVVDQR
jgi:hypothetical protein